MIILNQIEDKSINVITIEAIVNCEAIVHVHSTAPDESSNYTWVIPDESSIYSPSIVNIRRPQIISLHPEPKLDQENIIPDELPISLFQTILDNLMIWDQTKSRNRILWQIYLNKNLQLNSPFAHLENNIIYRKVITTWRLISSSIRGLDHLNHFFLLAHSHPLPLIATHSGCGPWSKKWVF